MLRLLRFDVPAPFKRILPQSLFGRALLILVVPTILVQLVATYIFYDRHWDNVSRWLAASLTGEISLLVHEMNEADPERRERLKALAQQLMSIHVTLEDIAPDEKFSRAGRDVSPQLFEHLQRQLTLPFTLALVDGESQLQVRVRLKDQILTMEVTRKRLISSTTYIFISWMLGSALLLTGIAVIFLRNQIRPITKLADAMDGFGKGIDAGDFRPQGAVEVRRAGRAFLQMRQRIDRQITARMEMLAGISHDLRTPLTRMKLQLAMLAEKDAASDLQRDVADMEHMIGEYLDFVRGEGQEAPQRITLSQCLNDTMSRYEQVPVRYHGEGVAGEELYIRPHVFRRALTNVIDNALRYGGTARVQAQRKHHYVEIVVDDDGPGIPRLHREEVFKPFNRLDQSRNAVTGGIGLGLTITRDIIHAHGGDVRLLDAPDGGLRVIIRLPRL